MLVIPDGASPLGCIIGIDPGTSTLGVGILKIDVITLSIIESTAMTFHGDKLIQDSWYGYQHGNRAERIAAHENNLVDLFNYHRPNLIASESPFFNRAFPQAYGALTETVDAIRNAVWRYDCWLSLFMIDPPSVKKAIGATAHAKKDEVKEALLRLVEELHYTGSNPIHLLDEHSVDALAVAYARLRILREQYK